VEHFGHQARRKGLRSERLIGIGALGYTIQRPTEDRYLMTREELENKIAVLLGGRAAEHLVFGHLSTGAADDLSKATDIARSMVTRFGMGEALGPVTYETEPTSFLGQAYRSQRLYGEETAREIDMAVRGIVETQFQRARAILAANRALLLEVAGTLLANETLAGAQLEGVLERVGKESGPRIAATATGWCPSLGANGQRMQGRARLEAQLRGVQARNGKAPRPERGGC
jgi:cell division protease FtsH